MNTWSIDLSVSGRERYDVGDQGPVRVEVGPDYRLSFDDFYRREFASIVAIASTMVGRAAEDVAQEAMIRAHDRWSTVGAMDKPGAWVRRVAINLATSRLRRRSIEVKAKLRLLGDRQPVAAVGAVDDELLAAVAGLPAKQRAAIALHYLDDRPVGDIAEILQCSTATARVHLHRGRAALFERLGNGDRR